MAVIYSYRFFYRSIDKSQYQQVEIGMSRDEIRNILKEPVKITSYASSRYGRSEVWVYNIKYSLLMVSIWFRPDEKNIMRVFEKTWGFE
jgi:hypothetical protein